MNKVTRRRVFAAVLLIAVAMTTVAYASLSFGVDVAIEAVNVSLVGVTVSPNIPARSTYLETYTDGASGLNITGLTDLAAGDVLRIRVELIMNRALSDGVRNMLVIIDTNDDSNFNLSDTVLTMNNPWQEFSYTVTGTETGGAKNFRVAVLITAGANTVTAGSFNVIGEVIGFAAA